MKFVPEAYIDHFKQYGCKFYKTTEYEQHSLVPSDERWLRQYGLPDGAIPFFFFDFYIGMLRDVKIDGSKFVLGTAFDAISRHYLFVNQSNEVMLQMEDQSHLLVNSSIAQLSQCIYAYSSWLENVEDLFEQIPKYVINDETVFELYYILRDIDRKAIDADKGIWAHLIHSDIRYNSHKEFLSSEEDN